MANYPVNEPFMNSVTDGDGLGQHWYLTEVSLPANTTTNTATGDVGGSEGGRSISLDAKIGLGVGIPSVVFAALSF